MNMAFYTLLSQLMFSGWFFIIHFVPIPPLNDIDKFPNAPDWKKRLFISWVILILLVIGYSFGTIYLRLPLILTLCLFIFGHINTWWLPYLFGWPKIFIDNVEIDHKATLRFLPPRGKRPVPDVAYCILGLLGLATLILSIINLR